MVVFVLAVAYSEQRQVTVSCCSRDTDAYVHPPTNLKSLDDNSHCSDWLSPKLLLN